MEGQSLHTRWIRCVVALKDWAGAKTRRETIDRALREFTEHRRVQELAALAGVAHVDMGLEELKTWRSEFEAAE